MILIPRRATQAGALSLVLLGGIAELSGQHSIYALDFVVSGTAFVVAGVIAWSLRPANRVGILMTAVGLGLLIASVAQDTTAEIAYPGTMVLQWLSTLWEALLIHLMIAFPEGRLGTQTKRWFVAA